MKKDSINHAFFGFLLAILFVQCDSVTHHQAPVTEGKVALTDTSAAQSNTDTSMLTTSARPAIKSPDLVSQTGTLPAAKPKLKKTPIATKTSDAKQKPGVKTPTANVPASKTPDVTPPVSTSTPKEETKPPSTIPTPKAPKVAYAAFSLNSKKAVIKGSSSLHDWESAITQMEGKGSFETKDDVLVGVKDVEIKIAVKGIKSTEGKKMDNKTYETFKADKNPYITYTLSNAVVKTNASNMVTIEALGKLTMAGNTQSAPLSATGKKLPNGDLQLSFSKKLKMTDFKMEPPDMLLGTIKVGDEITVDFDFVLTGVK